MENIPDNRAGDDAVTPIPVAPPRGGRPGHSIFSILVMGLISAAALYGVRWSVADHTRIVYAWDFREVSPTTTPWAFPGMGKEQDGNGVVSLAVATGPGPELAKELDTSEIGSIRINLEAYRFADDTPVPITLEWYWASEADIAAADGKFPYTTDRGMTLVERDPHTPTIHTIKVKELPMWTGNVARCFIGLKFPEDEPGPFKVRTFKIEFLE